MDRLENRVGVVKQQQGEENTRRDLFLKWGNKKRLRRVRIKDQPDDTNSDHSFSLSGRRRIRRRINSRFVAFPTENNNNNTNNNNTINNTTNNIINNNNKISSTRLTRNSETIRSENSRKHSPEKDTYTSKSGFPAEKAPADGGGQKVKHVWPKLYLTVSNKEKEEDFMAMKGCKPSHRPKKRPKLIQRSLLLVSPGGWLSDICQDRYDVIEKKNTKKRPTGLKAMGSMESDSE